ncbi:hypothetical protein CGRA01v4_00896 [Colletotrichum graminicola]|nr:hypothetical protein CGRA01v4_00896 [Colletotrichum graminicola]
MLFAVALVRCADIRWLSTYALLLAGLPRINRERQALLFFPFLFSSSLLHWERTPKSRKLQTNGPFPSRAALNPPPPASTVLLTLPSRPRTGRETSSITLHLPTSLLYLCSLTILSLILAPDPALPSYRLLTHCRSREKSET